MNWISVKDKVPNLNAFVLSTDGNLVSITSYEYNEHIQEYYWNYLSSGCGCCDKDMPNVTHWMPLPEPPQ